MGVVFNDKDIREGVHHNNNIKKQVKCPKSLIQRAPLNVLTPQNKQFLKKLNLKIRRKFAA